MKFDIKSLINKPKDAIKISVPLEKELYGVKIRKLPNGAYIKALQVVQDLPKTLLEGCFPGQDIDDILKYFGSIDADGITLIAGKLLATLPEQFLNLISVLLDIPIEKLTNELSPPETLEILEAYWEANYLAPFYESLKRKVMGLGLMQTLTEKKD